LPKIIITGGRRFPRRPGTARRVVATVPSPSIIYGGYANRDFLKPAKEAGFVVARLRRDARLYDLPPKLKPGQERGPGRPPTYGKNRLSLAKRAG
jgi:hypothetical protein